MSPPARFHLLLVISALSFLAGCASNGSARESRPTLHVAPNDSGLRVGPAEYRPARALVSGVDAPPDVPSGLSARVQPIQPFYQKKPRHFVGDWGNLEVVSVENLKRYDHQYHRFTDDLAYWKHLLDHETNLGAKLKGELGQLSEIPWVNGGRCFAAKVRRENYPWGRAILFLTTYVQGSTGGPVNNDAVVLVVQGLTHDGRFAVRGHFQIYHPRLPATTWSKRTKGQAWFDIDDEDDAAGRWLDRQPDDSFRPTFRQYDALLRAMRIEVERVAEQHH